MSAKHTRAAVPTVAAETAVAVEATVATETPSHQGGLSRTIARLRAWRRDLAEKKVEKKKEREKEGEREGTSPHPETGVDKKTGKDKKDRKVRGDRGKTPVPVSTGNDGRPVGNRDDETSGKNEVAGKNVALEPVEEDPLRVAERERRELLRCRPAADRGLYRTAMQREWKRILEIGIHDGTRGRNLLLCATAHHPKDSLVYVGIDLFEASGDTTGSLSLKEAQKTFAPLAGKTRLLPGDPLSVLKANAKSIGTVDAIVLSTGLDRRTIDQCWELFMQLCHDGSVLLVEPSPNDRRPRWRCLTSEDVLEVATWKAS
ncbi:MAG: hypothetical protein Q4C47_05430 [Planctomycetia bacterium]|nr:hypothetical protein [Planctomycetia bacterium]